MQEDRLDVNIKALTDSVIKNLFKLGALQEGGDKKNCRSVASQCDVSVKMDNSIVICASKLWANLAIANF